MDGPRNPPVPSTTRRPLRFWPLLALVAVSGIGLAFAARSAFVGGPSVDQGIGAHSEDIKAPDSHEPLVPMTVGAHGSYVTSAACKRCHEREYETWHASYHRTMTQFATPESVAAPLAGVKLESEGRACQFEQRGNQFFVTLPMLEWEVARMQLGPDAIPDQDPPLVTREIVLLTGSHNMQTFWIRCDDGFRQVPWYWSINDKAWIPAEHSFLEPPGARGVSRWNDNCIKCHASGEVPGMHPTTGFKTRVAELGIACEACHGHGQAHIAFHERQTTATGSDAVAKGVTEQDPICNPAEQTHVTASQICAQCHSSALVRNLESWLVRGHRFQPGDNLHHHFHVVQSGKPIPKELAHMRSDFWEDGTCRTGGDEYQGLVESACHQRGMLSCLSCHSLHGYADRSDQLKQGMDGNAACLQCHEQYAEQLESHTHHAAGSSGSLCYNCHMPHITYGLMKGIRSHRIDSPSAAVTAKAGRPNACNLCHLDQTLEWSASHLSDWYGQPAVELGDDDRNVAASVRALLSGDAAQRVITAWHMGWPEAQAASGNDWQGALLPFTLDDPYSVIRYVGSRSLRSTPGFADFQYNYFGPPQERKEAVEKALAHWRKVSGAMPSRQAVLLDEGGNLLTDEVQRLKKGRDNRPVTIHE